MLIDLPRNYDTGQDIQFSTCKTDEKETQTSGASEFKYLLGTAY